MKSVSRLRLTGLLACALPFAGVGTAETDAGETFLDALCRKFAAETTFCTDFEEPEALVAGGSETPKIIPGAQGEGKNFDLTDRGLSLADGTLSFSAEKNLEPTTGTVVFLMKIERPNGKMDPDEENFWPLYVQFEKGEMLAGKMSGRNKAPIYAYLQGRPEIPLVIANTEVSTQNWNPNDWRLVIVSWQPGALKISLDGRPFTTDPRMPSISEKAKLFEIRAANRPNLRVAVDDFVILNRPLSNEEAAWIFSLKNQTAAE